MNICALCRLALCVALLAVSVTGAAGGADARQAAREMERLFKMDDPAKRLKAAEALPGDALERAAAEAAIARAQECQRTAPRKLPALKAVHEGACEYLYKVTSQGKAGDTIYENFALVDAPPGLAADKPVPLVIGLHDALSTAWLELAALRGAKATDSHPLRECLVVCPQALNRGNTTEDPRANPAGKREYFGWGPKWPGVDTVLVLLDRLLADFNIDRSRIYIEGAGMGAEGALRIAQLRPTTFAAVLVRDGLPPHYYTGMPFSDADKVEELRKAGTLAEQKVAFPRLCNLRCTPVHWLHADQDTRTPTAHARQARDELKASGAEVVFTEYAGQHASALVPDFTRFLSAGLVVRRPGLQAAVAVQGSRDSEIFAGSSRCGWLQIVKQEFKGGQTDWPEHRQAGGTVQAACERETNTLRVTAEGVSEVRIHLDDSLLYLDQPVKLVVNGKERGTVSPVRRLSTIGETAVRYAHSNEAYSAAVTVEIR